MKIEFVFRSDEDGPKAAGELRNLILDEVFTADALTMGCLHLVSSRGSWAETLQTVRVKAGRDFWIKAGHSRQALRRYSLATRRHRQCRS